MNRRDTMLLLLALPAAPPSAFAQQPSRKLPRIGWLVPGTQASQQVSLDQYRDGMRELGYVEGRTVETEYVYAEGPSDRLPALAAELVAHKVDVIVTVGTAGCVAAQQATKTIPIVFAANSDPVSTGLVASLARPGGNITGLSQMASDLSAKRVDLLHALLPGASRMAALWDASNPGMALRVRETQLAAEHAKIAFFDAGARDLEGLEVSFAELLKQRPDALLVTAEPFTIRHRDRIVEFAMRSRIPAMYEESRFVEAGGLMSYGPSIRDMFRRAATYVDKILKGAKPSELPVEQPTKLELVINLKTAQALGIAIPPEVLLRADKVLPVATATR